MTTRPKIYLFGDSITEDSFSLGGWGASLANHFSRTVLFIFHLLSFHAFCVFLFVGFVILV
jgi:hypothetical protein